MQKNQFRWSSSAARYTERYVKTSQTLCHFPLGKCRFPALSSQISAREKYLCGTGTCYSAVKSIAFVQIKISPVYWWPINFYVAVSAFEKDTLRELFFISNLSIPSATRLCLKFWQFCSDLSLPMIILSSILRSYGAGEYGSCLPLGFL